MGLYCLTVKTCVVTSRNLRELALALHPSSNTTHLITNSTSSTFFTQLTTCGVTEQGYYDTIIHIFAEAVPANVRLEQLEFHHDGVRCTPLSEKPSTSNILLKYKVPG